MRSELEVRAQMIATSKEVTVSVTGQESRALSLLEAFESRSSLDEPVSTVTWKYTQTKEANAYKHRRVVFTVATTENVCTARIHVIFFSVLSSNNSSPIVLFLTIVFFSASLASMLPYK